MDIQVIGAYAAISAAIIGAVALTRNIIRDKPRVKVEVVAKKVKTKKERI